MRVHRIIGSVSIILWILCSVATSQVPQKAVPLLIRCDDIGMCHAVNQAAIKVLEAGIPVSMSFMVPCPWFDEAVSIAKRYPHVSVGIHLTLNAEWKNYRWGPVAGATAVPSLVDSIGNFFPSRGALFANNPQLNEIERELRAQIEKAVRAGLKIDYLDYHMGAAMQTLETRAIVERLAAEFQVAVSRYYGEVDIESGYAVPVDHKKDSLLATLNSLSPDGTKLLVVHIGLQTPEMDALEDMNPWGPKDMSRHREAELNSLLSPEVQTLLKSPRFQLVNYRMLNEQFGIGSMKRPPVE